jgi:hypothetical protein
MNSIPTFLSAMLNAKSATFLAKLLLAVILLLSTQASFAQLDCKTAEIAPLGKTIKGNTNNGKSGVSTYNNDPWWQLTGPEMVHRLDWPGGEVSIKLSNKSAALDLILLRSCNNNDFVSSGGGNSGTKESTIKLFLNPGTYYIVVDGWQGAKGTYDLTIIQSVSILVDVLNRVSRTFFLQDSVLYEQKATGNVIVSRGVESIASNFGYVTNPSTGEGKQEEVLTIKKYGQAFPKVFLNNNFDTDYLKQRLFCPQRNLSLYGDLVFDGNKQVLANCDLLRCENGYSLAHQNDSKIKLYNTSAGTWTDVLQIITVENKTYYTRTDSTVWALSGDQARQIGTKARLLQDNDNQLIKIDAKGIYQRWDGSAWANLTPKYVSVSPQMNDEGFWFFMQAKPLLESNAFQTDHRRGLTFDKNDKLQMEVIPATDNCERFLWRSVDAGGGKRLLINKAKGENFPLLLSAAGTLTFTSGQGVKEWEIKQSDASKYGSNAYQLIGASATRALSFGTAVQSEAPLAGNRNQTWVFQFNQMVKDYFLPLPTKANLLAHYVDNPNVNVNTSADAIGASYNKFLKGNNGVTFFATNTSSDWVLVNYYLIISNMLDAVVAPKPSDSKVDPNIVKTTAALKGQSLILINKNDLNSAVPTQFFTTWMTKPNAAQFRGMAAYGNPKKAILANEELTCKTGITNRPLDRSFRKFDHGVHEFAHALQELCGYIPIVDANNMCDAERGRSSECFCFDIQNWFNSNGGGYFFPGLRAYNAGRNTFMKKIFNEANTWMPPVDLRLDGYNPSSAALPTFGVLACGDAPLVTIGKTIAGNNSNGRNLVSTYNNDPWWQLTGPEALHKLEWPGGEITIKLSNKSAALDLLLLRSCNNNDLVNSGGGNSGTKESTITMPLPKGTYYIVVDGWQLAQGSYDLLVTQKGTTPTQDLLPATAINAYPNPFDEVLNIEVNLEKPTAVDVEIMDALGRVLRVIKSSAITNKHKLQVQDLDYKGVMFVKVSGDGKYGMRRVVSE